MRGFFLPRIRRLRLAVNQRAILTSILWLSNGFLALFEAERIVASFDDVTMVGNTVEQGSMNKSAVNLMQPQRRFANNSSIADCRA
jgi:hypothetical protein